VVLHPPQPRRVMPLHVRVDLVPAVSQLPLELRVTYLLTYLLC
jgi:hypothetical protein